MIQIEYNKNLYTAKEDDSILECLLRNDIPISYSCKSGICQSCLVQVSEGEIDSKFQKGLSKEKIKNNLVYACSHPVRSGMKLSSGDSFVTEQRAAISGQRILSEHVFELKLHVPEPDKYSRGQFLSVIRNDGLCRSYSIADINDNFLYFHIQRIKNGKMSNWLSSSDNLSSELSLRGPFGECVYWDDYKDNDIILVGTGTGLAPLYGVLLDALQSGHQQRISLVHASLDLSGLYLVEELLGLSIEYKNFEYLPLCLNQGNNLVTQGDIFDFLKEINFNFSKAVSFICGNPEMVNKIKKTVFLRGSKSNLIFSDPFIESRDN